VRITVFLLRDEPAAEQFFARQLGEPLAGDLDRKVLCYLVTVDHRADPHADLLLAASHPCPTLQRHDDQAVKMNYRINTLESGSGTFIRLGQPLTNGLREHACGTGGVRIGRYHDAAVVTLEQPVGQLLLDPAL